MPTALIVEDEPEANKLLGMLLRLRGYQTESAFTGKEALQLVEKSQPDIIFLDLMLPGPQRLRDLQDPQVVQGNEPDPAGDRHRPDRGREPHRELLPRRRRLHRQALHARPDLPGRRTGRPLARPEPAADRSRGGVSFDHSDDGEILRRLGQLRSLIFARTTLGLEAVRADRPGHQGDLVRGRRVGPRLPDDPITTLVYTLTADRLILEFHDAAWLAGEGS